jgi:hypothetical protein
VVVTVEALRTDVRAKFQNLDPGMFSDEALDLDIRLGLSRLSSDRPYEANYTLAATGEKHNLNSLISNWLHDFSVIKSIWLPTPTTSMGRVDALKSDTYRVVTMGSTDWLYVSGGVSSSGALIVYTIPHTLTGIAGAAVTTVPDLLYPPLLHITGHHVAMSQASKMSGQRDKQMPADFVNFGTSNADQYRRQAREFERDYLSAMNLSFDRPKAIGMVRNMPSQTPTGEPWMTHRTTGVGYSGR